MELTNYINFVKDNPNVLMIDNDYEILNNFSEFEKYFDIVCKTYNKFCVVYPCEVFLPEVTTKLQELIKSKKNNEIYISHSSSKVDDYFLPPILNLFFWQRQWMRENISWYSNTAVLLFDKNFYKGDYIKNNRGIFSTRKTTFVRDRLFSKLKDINFNGIYRYASWPRESNNENHLYNQKNFPTFIELLEEYKKSYISFIMESEKNSNINCMTEKTLVPFLTKTIPVFYNSSNYCKELEDMGFYTFNNLFGLDDEFDSLDMEDDNKINKFIDSINLYNNLNSEDILNDFYLKNIDKINHNYNLAHKFLIDDIINYDRIPVEQFKLI